MARRKLDKAALASLIREMKELSNEQKADLLQLLNEQKRYGLVWEEHKEEAQEVLSENIPVLVEDCSKRIQPLHRSGESEGAPNHILIEGDNLHALTALTYTHEGKVDVIYIDPPYNTGNKDFVYNDSFVDSEDGYRHSKWLSFMEKRLRIAKKLLSDRGVIFISIDDNEQANLKLLCDEIIGSDKFICNFIWQKKTGAADAKGIAVITEYILVYCMSPMISSEVFAYNKEAFDIKRYRFTDEYSCIRGPHYYDSLDRGSIRYSDSQNYPIEAPDGTLLYPNDRTEFVNDGWTWKWSKEKVLWGIANGFISIVPNAKKKSGWSVKYKIYLNVDNEGNEIKKNVPYKNLITDILNTDATNEIKELFGGKAFNYAKPTALIKKLIGNIKQKDSTILDFFAGSGTTFHATMQLNAEDGGHRKCILVTNNENGICEEVTYERNKRVINGYTTPKGVEVAGLKDNNLRYYKVEFTERENSSANRQKLMQMATDMLCIKHDLYDEQKQFGSLKFKSRYARYFANKEKQMLVVYEPRAIEYVAKELRENQTLATKNRKLMIFAYSDGAYAYNDEFEGLEDVIELTAMPEALNQAIRNVLPPQKEDNFINEEGGQKE